MIAYLNLALSLERMELFIDFSLDVMPSMVLNVNKLFYAVIFII